MLLIHSLCRQIWLLEKLYIQVDYILIMIDEMHRECSWLLKGSVRLNLQSTRPLPLAERSVPLTSAEFFAANFENDARDDRDQSELRTEIDM